MILGYFKIKKKLLNKIDIETKKNLRILYLDLVYYFYNMINFIF